MLSYQYRGYKWALRHSWIMLLALVPGFSWAVFLYMAIRARQSKLAAWAVGFAVFEFYLWRTYGNPLRFLGTGIGDIVWIVGIANAFKARPQYLSLVDDVMCQRESGPITDQAVEEHVDAMVSEMLDDLVHTNPSRLLDQPFGFDDAQLVSIQRQLQRLGANWRQREVHRLEELVDRAISRNIESARLSICGDQLSKFVSLHYDETHLWPKEMTIPDKDITTFFLLLEREGSPLTHGEVETLVELAWYREQYKTFEKSLRAANTWLPDKPTKDELSRAYVHVFADNMRYVDYLVTMMKAYGTQRSQVEAQWDVEDACRRCLNDHRIDALVEAMEKGEQETIKYISIEDVDAMDGSEFEEFVGSLFAAMGYDTVITSGSHDQGADVIAEMLGNKIAIQAKCYSGPVSNSAVQEVVAAKGLYQCSEAIVVTNSHFTKSAHELASANGVELIDREELIHLMKVWPIRSPCLSSE